MKGDVSLQNIEIKTLTAGQAGPYRDSIYTWEIKISAKTIIEGRNYIGTGWKPHANKVKGLVRAWLMPCIEPEEATHGYEPILRQCECMEINDTIGDQFTIWRVKIVKAYTG